MEKGNAVAAGGPQVMQADGGATAGAAGTAGATAVPPATGATTDPGSVPSGGSGGQQADQSGPESGNVFTAFEEAYQEQYGGGDEEAATRERMPTGEIVNPDGSRLRATQDGWEYTDASGRTGVWDSTWQNWYHPTTEERMPDDFGMPDQLADATAGDYEEWAGSYNDAARLARERGDQALSDYYRGRYDDAVQQARALRGQEGGG